MLEELFLIFLPTGFMLSCREDVHLDPIPPDGAQGVRDAISSLEVTYDRARNAS